MDLLIDLPSLNVLSFLPDKSVKTSLVLAHYFDNSFFVFKYAENRLLGKGQVVFFRNTFEMVSPSQKWSPSQPSGICPMLAQKATCQQIITAHPSLSGEILENTKFCDAAKS